MNICSNTILEKYYNVVYLNNIKDINDAVITKMKILSSGTSKHLTKNLKVEICI